MEKTGIKSTSHYHEEPSIISELSNKLAVANFQVGWLEGALRYIAEMAPIMKNVDISEYVYKSIKDGEIQAYKRFGGKQCQ